VALMAVVTLQLGVVIAVAKALWSLNPSTPLRERSHKYLNHLGGCYTLKIPDTPSIDFLALAIALVTGILAIRY
jgi:hypothetical protein